MGAGKYRDLIRIEHLVESGNPSDPDYSAAAPSWTLLAEVRAEVQDVMPSRDESVKSGVRLSSEMARVRIRYRPDITIAMRIVETSFRKRTMAIVGGPAALGRMRELEFMVERKS